MFSSRQQNKRTRSRDEAAGPAARAPLKEIGQNRLLHALQHHLQCLPGALGRLAARPLGSLFTLGVIAIALSLPLGLTTLLNNARDVTRSLEALDQIAVFLETGITDSSATALADDLGTNPGITVAGLLDPETALAEFRSYSGFGDALDVLDTNPLPWVIVLDPDDDSRDVESISRLIEGIEQRPEVDFAQYDLIWLQRLGAIMSLSEHMIYAIGILLLLAALLIIGNTIRLEIQNRRAEIEISKLMGATDGYVRRPFLYSGLCYGLGGGIIALLLVTGLLMLLQSRASELARSYQTEISIQLPDVLSSGVLLLISVSVGLIGAWLAVSRQISDIQPD